MEGARERPPVNEVVLTVVISPREELLGPKLPAILGTWYDTHPQVQIAPPYRMPVEQDELVPSPSIRLLEEPAIPRYWLRSLDDREVIQIQPDSIALGWRRRSPEEEYVRYESLRKNFLAMLDRLTTSIGSDAVRPRRAEITYTNIIYPNALWSHTGEVHKLFKVPAVGDQAYEQLAFSFSRRLTAADTFAGRLHVALSPGIDTAKQEPALQLNITGRSGELDEPDITSAIRFLDLAHASANRSFLGLLTDDARKLWGL